MLRRRRVDLQSDRKKNLAEGRVPSSRDAARGRTGTGPIWPRGRVPSSRTRCGGGAERAGALFGRGPRPIVPDAIKNPPGPNGLGTIWPRAASHRPGRDQTPGGRTGGVYFVPSRVPTPSREPNSQRQFDFGLFPKPAVPCRPRTGSPNASIEPDSRR
jgi:hypothetical protein